MIWARDRDPPEPRKIYSCTPMYSPPKTAQNARIATTMIRQDRTGLFQAGVVMEVNLEPQNGGFATNLPDAADSLPLLIQKRSHSLAESAKVLRLYRSG
jgi:hypothetical protein